MPKWTDGPYWVDRNHTAPRIVAPHKGFRGGPGSSGEYVAHLVQPSCADLFAAAPELYAALLEISDALEGTRAANPEASIEFSEELVEIEPGWRQRLRAALAKARGEQPQGGTDAR